MSDFKNPITVNGSLVWNASNDGTGSGLDADLLDGKHASEFANSAHTHSSTDIIDTIATKSIPSTTQTIPANTNTKVNFNSNIFNFGTGWDGINSRFTNNNAHMTIFRVNCNIFLNSTTSGELMVYRNGTVDTTAKIYIGTSNSSNFSGSTVVDMQPGDYIEIFIRVSTSRTIQTTSILFVTSVN